MRNTWPEERQQIEEEVQAGIDAIKRGDPVMAAEVVVGTAVELLDDGIRLTTDKQPADE
jgi:hypothetical protein